MDSFFDQIWNLITTVADPRNLRHPERFQEALSQPSVFWAAFVTVTLIVFTETGLLVGFLLPGDSLLVTVGVVAYGADWPIHYLIPTLWVAAVLGDSCGYLIGWKVGPRVFQKEKSFFFRKKYLLMAQEFYARHGGKTIILAKFVPIIRTFAPVVAGASSMPYRRFAPYSACGAMCWIPSMILLGYTLHLWVDPILKPIFGPDFQVAKQIDKVIFVVVMLSVLPLMWKAYKGWQKSRSNRAAVLPSASTRTPV